MRRGEPLLDSDDADLAIALAEQAEREARALRPLHLVSVPVGAALVLLGLAGGGPALTMGGVAGLAVSGLLVVTSSRRLRRFRHSLASTRELAGMTSAWWSG